MGQYYYPAGGAHDFIMSDDNPKGLENYAKEQIEKELVDWWHIYDSVEQKIIEGNEVGKKPLW